MLHRTRQVDNEYPFPGGTVSVASTENVLSTPEIHPDLDQVRAHFLALHRPGEVREVRILGHVPLLATADPQPPQATSTMPSP